MSTFFVLLYKNNTSSGFSGACLKGMPLKGECMKEEVLYEVHFYNCG